jgi:hypothetical protein
MFHGDFIQLLMNNKSSETALVGPLSIILRHKVKGDITSDSTNF